MADKLKTILWSSIIYIALAVVFAIVMVAMQASAFTNPNAGMAGGLLVVFVIFLIAFFVLWLIIWISMLQDAKARGLSAAYFLLGFFLSWLGGIIYYVIAKDKPAGGQPQQAAPAEEQPAQEQPTDEQKTQ